MSLATVLMVGIGLVAVTYFVVLCVRANFAQNRALDGLQALETELAATRDTSVGRYHTGMPDRRQYDDELHCASSLIGEWRNKVEELRNQPLNVKLTRAWCAQCDELARRTNGAVRQLQE
ncbi:MAG: hypothetical protein K2X93_09205, partial [Candidatus Obscuribacterales bacterium]|nr:hypothetical protein [Candidatus Obscuribacterales bacterium]